MGAHRTGSDTDPPSYDDGGAEPRRRDIDRLFRDRELDLPPELRAEVHDAAERLFGAPSEAPYKPGDRLGVYRVVRLLGAGGQAFVYEATHEQLARRVALKVPRPEVAERIIREARMTAPLEHPHIVRVEDISADREAPFLVMECCTGGSLDQLLERYPNGLPMPDVRSIARAVLEALEFAHRRGIVHRDVKPANVLFDSRGTPKLADLGIGTIATGGPDLVQSVGLSHGATHDGPMGTPLFVAPEQEDPSRLRGAAIDARADLFSFGKMLFVMLTGASPRTIRPPSRLRPGLDPAWDDLVFKLVEEARERRPESARQALELLAKVPEPTPPRVRVTPLEVEAVTAPAQPALRDGRPAATAFVLAALASLAFTGFLHAEHAAYAFAPLKVGALLGGVLLLWFSRLERRAVQGRSVLAALAVSALFAAWSPTLYALHAAHMVPSGSLYLAARTGAVLTVLLGLFLRPALFPRAAPGRVRVRPRAIGTRATPVQRVFDGVVGAIGALVSALVTTGVLLAAHLGLFLVLVLGLELAPQFAALVTLKVGVASFTVALFVWFLRRLLRGDPEREADAG